MQRGILFVYASDWALLLCIVIEFANLGYFLLFSRNSGRDEARVICILNAILLLASIASLPISFIEGDWGITEIKAFYLARNAMYIHVWLPATITAGILASVHLMKRDSVLSE